MDSRKVGKYDLPKYCVLQERDFPFADELNSMARLASADPAWFSISRFYDNCKNKKPGKKGWRC
jgi:putative transposase